MSGAIAFSLLFKRGPLPLCALFWKAGSREAEAALVILAEVATRFSGRLLFAAIDVATDAGLDRHFSVERVPLVLLFKDGKERGRLEAPLTGEALCRWLEGLT